LARKGNHIYTHTKRGGYKARLQKLQMATVPMMFQPGNPFPIAYGSEAAISAPTSFIPGISMETAPELFNENYRAGMGLWNENLPQPEIYDSFEDAGLDETAQSQNEIVQKILLKPQTKPFHQHEFFFVVNKNSALNRSHYSYAGRVPCEALTLHDMRVKAKSLSVRDLVQDYLPVGVFFTFVDTHAERNQSNLVAYSLGGLCDILNVWHVCVIPGSRLFFVAFKNDDDQVQIVPYAGLYHPLEEKNDHPWNGEEVAIIDVGVVCAGNSRPPQQLLHANYLVKKTKAGVLYPDDHLPSGLGGAPDATNPEIPQVQGNILRVKLNALQWTYFEKQ